MVKCLYLSIYLVYQLRSFIEISRSAILKNIKILKTFDVCIYAVVKNNAYGHGMKQIVSILQKTDLDTVCLSHNEEVFQLYKIGWDRRIILFSAIIDSSLFSILKIYPDHKSANYNLGYINYLMGNFELAIQFFSTASFSNPNYSAAYYGIGLCYKEIGKQELAKENFEKVLSLEPEDELAQIELNKLR